MFLAILTLLSALSISAIAAFYSIVGLATIFPGAYWPVVAMGSALEAGKLVCASWLYSNWHNTNKALRGYLFSAVIVLSLITSMGIFGFLSKAHLETNFQSSNNSQQISIINSQIKSEQDVIERQQEIIKRNSVASGGSGERIAQLRDKIKQLDREVEAYTSQGATSTFFNDKVAKGIELKNQQKAERDAIDREIKQLTTANQGNNSAAEAQIARSQQRIQQLINQRAPLQVAQVKIDAEIGPIKYIGALAVDVGLAKAVDVEAAVRWVIIIIIFVFDPLAVLMLVAANQSFAQRFPTLLEKPKEIIDLEKPDLDPPPAPETKNNIINEIKNKYEIQLKEWQEKLARFNEKVPAPAAKEIEIVPIKAEPKKADDTVSYVIKDAVEIRTAEPESKKKRPEQIITQDNYHNKTERIRPDLTEVVEPEHTERFGILGRVLVKKNRAVVVEPKAMNIDPAESERVLKAFHAQHGRFQDATDVDLKNERDDINRRTFLEAYPVTAEDSRNHPPITASRMAYFQDYVDDVLRGNTTAESLPPEVARTVAIILSEHPNPAIVAKQPVNTAVEQTGLTTMTTEELKEHFNVEPKTEDRDITDQELDELIGDMETEQEKPTYIQNEEQQISNQWSRILEIKEPEKNEIILPQLPSIAEQDIPDLADAMPVDVVIPQEKITRHRNKMLTDDEYRRRIEDRINGLITKIEQGEVKLTELAEEDQKIIMGIMNSNG
jgi:hypothetical protein